ncbi:isochorismate synthase [Nocardioides alcanivorans]|uniref:isochorismate synthase n=1 Tax=Nocardioides alcanivorans TaxID=2897352 RepID=UPI001EFFF745|nr:isochorismate synthase [Nocardioides alcanivorans]
MFATGDRAYVGTRVRRTLTAPDGQDPAWASAVVAALEPGEQAVGALSFAEESPGLFHLTTGREQPLPPPVTEDEVERTHTVTEHPTAEHYAEMVTNALARIKAGEVAKVVLGRCLDVHSEPPLTPVEVINRLLLTRPGNHLFSVPVSADLDHGQVLVGASPELLVRRRGDVVECTPLAGSIPRSPDAAEDRARADGLLHSTKDHAEHAFVVDAIVHALKDVCVEVEAPLTPELVSTDTLWHLGSPIRARIAPGTEAPSALHLAQLLHPTPAVGGVPLGAAYSTIAELEGDLRKWFAGCVGWVDAAGDGEFAITIRSALLDDDHLRLFAGAGIVAGSVPELEVAETGAKLGTMAKVVGL